MIAADAALRIESVLQHGGGNLNFLDPSGLSNEDLGSNYAAVVASVDMLSQLSPESIIAAAQSKKSRHQWQRLALEKMVKYYKMRTTPCDVPDTRSLSITPFTLSRIDPSQPDTPIPAVHYDPRAVGFLEVIRTGIGEYLAVAGGKKLSVK